MSEKAKKRTISSLPNRSSLACTTKICGQLTQWKHFNLFTVVVNKKIYVKTNGSIIQKKILWFFPLVTLMHLVAGKMEFILAIRSISKASSKLLADVFFLIGMINTFFRNWSSNQCYEMLFFFFFCIIFSLERNPMFFFRFYPEFERYSRFLIDRHFLLGRTSD